MIDIISVLDEEGISYSTSGKNVTRGWVEINCPFCFDPSNHLGINLQSGLYNCWICGAKGQFKKLLQKILDKSYNEVNEIINKYDNYELEEEVKPSAPADSDLLKSYSIELPEPHQQYLIKRRFDPIKITKLYNIRSQYKFGYFAFRIIIPIIEEGRVVNITGRDITGKQRSKYKNLPNDKAIISMKDCLYNIDSVTNKAIIVEGPLDVWRIGPGCIATMGTEFTTAQIKLLKDKQIKKIFILYDSEASANALKLANALSVFSSVEILSLTEGDPADMEEKEVKELRKELS